MPFPALVVTVLAIAAAAAAVLQTTRLQAWAVAAIAGAGVLLLHVDYLSFYQADDAFISFRYARNSADGLGPVWNAGERVDGYTNFLWTAILALTAKLGLPLPTTASWGGVAAALGVLAVTALLACRWPETGRGPRTGGPLGARRGGVAAAPVP
jgi:hypothetical protein